MQGIKNIDHPRYCYERTEYIEYKLACMAHHKGTASIIDANGVLLAQLVDDVMALYPKYAHNGCSMVPDFEDSRPGCEVHDAAVQMLQNGAATFTLEDANRMLQEVQDLHDFGFNLGIPWTKYKKRVPLGPVYRWAVGTWFARKFMGL